MAYTASTGVLQARAQRSDRILQLYGTRTRIMTLIFPWVLRDLNFQTSRIWDNV